MTHPQISVASETAVEYRRVCSPSWGEHFLSLTRGFPLLSTIHNPYSYDCIIHRKYQT